MTHEIGREDLAAEGAGITDSNCMGKLFELRLNLVRSAGATAAYCIGNAYKR